ncbi:MAG: DM9 repeat-containing protein [Oligoflexus sp.]
MKNLPIFSLILALNGCDSRQFDKSKTEKSLITGSADANSPAKLENSGVFDEEQLVVVEDESIVIPTAIAGAYLSCVAEEFSSEPRVADEQNVYCAVRNQDDRNLVKINELETEIKWSFEGDEALRSKLQISALADHKQYHARFHFQNLSAAEIQSVKSSGKYVVGFTQGDLVLATAKASSQPLPYNWLKLDGAALPSNAFLGGSEYMNENLIYLCRVYVENGLYPGKLMPHFQDPTKTVCYTIAGNTAIESYSPDATTLQYESDALILPDAGLIDRFTWVPAENGDIPDNALATGYTNEGELLYACRGLEAGPPGNSNDKPNDPNGEWTPGHINPGATGCTHEYYGARLNLSYEVLVVTP